MSMHSAVTGQPRIDSEKIFTFPQGIPGFEEYTTFKIFHKDDNAVSAYWLESCDSPAITFTLVDPTEYDLNYDLISVTVSRRLLRQPIPWISAFF